MRRTDTRSKEVVEEVRCQEQEVNPFDYMVARPDPSTWIIFSQILGVSNYQENGHSSKYDRSLTSVLSESKLLSMKSRLLFSSRQSIDKLICGDLAA